MSGLRRFKNKINSQRGASITFALLLFLVCAVVGSAVLVAGTAAAGRMSKIAENDQRYYSVNSAARLLINLIENDRATIIKTESTDATGAKTTAYTDETGESINADSFSSITREAAYYFATTTNPLNRSGVNSYKVDLTVSDKNALTAAIEERILDDGTMILKIVSGDDSSKSDTYAMQLTFNMDKTMLEETREKLIEGEKITENITTWKISWHIQDLQVIGAGRWTA